MQLAISMASSKVQNSIRETTGPKTSSRAMRICGVTWPKTVGAKKVPLAYGPSVRRLAAGEELGAFFDGDDAVFGAGFDLLFVDLGTDFDAFGEAVADA